MSGYTATWKAARAEYRSLLNSTLDDLRGVYTLAIRNLSKEIEELKPVVDSTGKYKLLYNAKMAFKRSAEREFARLAEVSTRIIGHGIERGFVFPAEIAEAEILRFIIQAQAMKAPRPGEDPLEKLAKTFFKRPFVTTNTDAARVYAASKHQGWTFSERIWNQAKTQSRIIQDMVHEGIARSRDVVQVARDLEKYVREGSRTLASDYKGMMGRMGRRIPKDLNYEALRLARTEMGTAFNEGVVLSIQDNPAATGVKWLRSNSGYHCDVCEALATDSTYGEPGFYPKGSEPDGTAHPNCTCTLAPMTDPNFIDRLVRFRDNPAGDPELSAWYGRLV